MDTHPSIMAELNRLRRRQDELEAEVDALRRRREPVAVHAATTRRAMLETTLNQGSTATAKPYSWSGSAWEYGGNLVTVREFTLNSGESYPAGLKGWIFEDVGGVYVFATDGCEPDDTGLGTTPATPPPPGPSQGQLLIAGGDALFAELAGGEPEPGFYDGELISN